MTPAIASAGSAVCTGVANGWVPLLALALPAALVLCAGVLASTARGTWTTRVGYLVAVALGVTGVVRGVYVLRGASLSAYTSPSDGAISNPNTYVALTVVVSVVMLVLLSASSLWQAQGPPRSSRCCSSERAG